MDDAVAARFVVEELVQRAHNDLIDIEKQGRPLEVVKVVGSDCQFSPEAHFIALRHALRQGEGDGLDALNKPFRALGYADESEGASQVLFDPKIELVDVKRIVKCTEFKADYIYWFFTLHY